MKNIIYKVLSFVFLLSGSVFSGCGDNSGPEVPTVYPNIVVSNSANNKITLDIGERFSAQAAFDNSDKFNIANYTLTFSSGNPVIFTVNQSTGEITAVAKGEAFLSIKTKENGKISGGCVVAVVDKMALIDGGLVVTNATNGQINLEVGDGFTALVAFMESYDYNIEDFTPYFKSLNTDIFTVIQETGAITAVAAGEGYLYAGISEADNVYVRCKVKITEKPIPTLQITNVANNQINMETGDTFQVAIAFTDPVAFEINDYTFTYTTDAPGIFTVGQSTGLITAVAAGEAYVSVKSRENGNISATCKVKITEKPIPTLKITNLTDGQINMKAGDTFQVAIAFTDPVAFEINDYTFTYTTDAPGIFTVGQSTGLITAVAAGEAYVSVKSRENGNISATCKVKVENKVLPNLIITNATSNVITVLIGKQFPVAVAFEDPSKDNINDYTLRYSSDKPAVFTVNETTGVITGVAVGEAVLKVKTTQNENIYTTCVVKIMKPIPTSALVITNSVNNTITLERGKQLTATVAFEDPSKDNINDYTLRYSSDKPAVFTVNETTGVITGVATGEAVLKVKTTQNEDIYTTCIVKVTVPVPTSNLVITNSVNNIITLERGKQFTAAVAFEDPSKDHISDYTLSFTSEKPTIFTVDQSTGVLKGVAKGEAILTVKTTQNPDVYTTCIVKVIPPVPSSNLVITNSMNDVITIERGKQFAVDVAFADPSKDHISDYTLQFTSGSAAIFTVTQSSGIITAVSEGEGYIYVKTHESEIPNVRCQVKVVKTSPVVVTAINISYTDVVRVGMNGRFDLGKYVSILPNKASFSDIKFTSDNENIALVDQYGIVTGFNYGWTDINVTSLDGGVKAKCRVHVSYYGYMPYERTEWIVSSSQPGVNMQNLVDQDNSTLFTWTKPGVNEVPSDHVPYFIIDMKDQHAIDNFTLRHRTDNAYEALRVHEASLYASDDNITYTPIAFNLAISTSGTSAIVEFPETTCRYFKFVCTKWLPRSGSSFLSLSISDFKLGYRVHLPEYEPEKVKEVGNGGFNDFGREEY